MTQEKASRHAEEDTEDTATAQHVGEVAVKNEKLEDDIDSILSEIDSVLEQNAEEFVRSYVQKGGQ